MIFLSHLSIMLESNPVETNEALVLLGQSSNKAQQSNRAWWSRGGVVVSP
jgi:hypothetical protein